MKLVYDLILELIDFLIYSLNPLADLLEFRVRSLIENSSNASNISFFVISAMSLTSISIQGYHSSLALSNLIWVAVGTLVTQRPRTDPSVRRYRTRLKNGGDILEMPKGRSLVI